MQTLMANVLAAWRRADRLAGELPPGPERRAAERAAARLRDTYQELAKAIEADTVGEGLVARAEGLVEMRES